MGSGQSVQPLPECWIQLSLGPGLLSFRRATRSQYYHYKVSVVIKRFYPNRNNVSSNSCQTTDGQTCVFPFTHCQVSWARHHPTQMRPNIRLFIADHRVTLLATRALLAEPGCSCGVQLHSACPWCLNQARGLTHQGVTHTSCTFQSGYSPPWCSTLIDDGAVHVGGNYGDCDTAAGLCTVKSGSNSPFTVECKTVSGAGGIVIRVLVLWHA